MNIRRLFAVWSAHFIKTACRLTGKQGATLAGKAALSIYPPILSELAKEVKKDIFVVCGTNGKTTTNNLLASVLEANGQKVICNRTGSNMLNGVVSAFVLNTGLSGHLKADYACIEIDEASTVRVFPSFSAGFYGSYQSVSRPVGSLRRNRHHDEPFIKSHENGPQHEASCKRRRLFIHFLGS